jgi:hypothetical protein
LIEIVLGAAAARSKFPANAGRDGSDGSNITTICLFAAPRTPQQRATRRRLKSGVKSKAGGGERVLSMATIIPFLRADEAVFDPKDITAMSIALDEVCKALSLKDDNSAREVMAVRIIDLAKAGERSPTQLRDKVLHEAGMADRIGLDGGSAATDKV